VCAPYHAVRTQNIKIMKKHWYYILIFTLLPIFTYGQGAYYSTYSKTSVGIILVKGGDIDNSRFCQVRNGENVAKYSPYEVKEFGFSDGRVYKSFSIKVNDTTSRYFLERLVEGKINLYYLKVGKGVEKFYLMECDSANLIEFPKAKEAYTVLLDSIVKYCPQATQNISLVKFNKFSIIRFIKDYNECAKRPYPRFKYGFEIGITSNRFWAVKNQNAPQAYSIPKYKNDWNISIGVFTDFPILFSNFSFHPEVYFNRTSISNSFRNGDLLYDLAITRSSISVPLLLRYTVISNKINPYFQLGPVFSKALKNGSILYEYKKVGNEIFIKTNDNPILHKNLGGISLGTGFISKKGSKHPWFGELRYTKFYNLGSGIHLLNVNEFTMGVGLIF